MNYSLNQDFQSKTNEFKEKVGELLEEFRHFTLDVQLELLTDVRLFVLEVEKLCSTEDDEDDGVEDLNKSDANISDLLPIVVASFNQVMAASLPEDSGKTTTADQIEPDCDSVANDPSSALEETDIGRIADYLIGLGKLADANSEVERIIMNGDSTSACLELSPGDQPPVMAAMAAEENANPAAAATSAEINRPKFKEVRERKAPQRNRNRTFRIGTRMNLRQLAVRRRVDNPPASTIANESSSRSKRTKRSSVRHRQQFFGVGDGRARKSSIATYRCNRCDDDGATFAHLKELRRHERIAHPAIVITAVNKLYGCDHCDRKFVKRPSLFAHRRRHAAPGEVVCLKCGVTSSDAEKHALHVRQWHGDRAPFRCTTCGEGFARRQQFERHTDGHRMYDCVDCRGGRGDAHCTTKKQLARHQRLVHGIRTREEKRQECPVCQKRFVRRRQLEIHHRHTHSDDARKCLPCSESIIPDRWPSATTSNAEVGLTTTTVTASVSATEVPVPVVVPSTQSVEKEVEEVVAMVRRQASSSSTAGDVEVTTRNTTDAVVGHRRRPRRDQPSKAKVTEAPSYLCAVCGATFLRRQCLVRHNRQQHDGTVFFKCNFCDYRCKCKDNLKRHVEVHLNERRRRYVCELCGASFNAFGTLKDHHRYVHSDERRHACPECGKAFKCGSALKRHLRAHNDQRPYVCTQCTQSYKRMSHLKRHIAIVHSAVFDGKGQRPLVSDGDTVVPKLPPDLPPPPALLPPFGGQQRFDAGTVDVDHDFLMMDVDHAKAACQMLLDEPAMVDMPMPADVGVTGPLPSMMQRHLHHHHHHNHLDPTSYMSNVDYGDPAACSDNVGLTSGTIHDLQPIVDVLQSDLDAGGTIGTKIADIFW